MEIKSTLVSRSLGVLPVVYRDIDSLDTLASREIQAVHAYCFYKGKLVVVYSASKGYWSLPGGGVKKGESVEEAVAREVREETNMRVLSQHILGYQEVTEPTGVVVQTRSVCIVEPIGDFVSDPDGDVTEIKFINPADLKTHIDWGKIGDRLISRALDMLPLIQS